MADKQIKRINGVLRARNMILDQDSDVIIEADDFVLDPSKPEVRALDFRLGPSHKSKGRLAAASRPVPKQQGG